MGAVRRNEVAKYAWRTAGGRVRVSRDDGSTEGLSLQNASDSALTVGSEGWVVGRLGVPA